MESYPFEVSWGASNINTTENLWFALRLFPIGVNNLLEC
jgi:hypothetical protein